MITKGEWIYSKYSPCDFGVHSLVGRGNDIALVRGEGEEAEANAKLISAAPELLAALQNLVDRDLIKDKGNDHYNEVREAIEKATS